MPNTRKSNPASEDKVFLGLQKKQQCKLCEQVFYVESLPAVISYKSILMLRQSWGMNVNFLSPSLMYRQVHICVFCEQFFSSMKDDSTESLGLPTKVRGTKKSKLSSTTTSTGSNGFNSTTSSNKSNTSPSKQSSKLSSKSKGTSSLKSTSKSSKSLSSTTGSKNSISDSQEVILQDDE